LALPSPLCWLTISPGTVSSTSPGRRIGRCSSSCDPTTPWLADAAMPTMSEPRPVTWICS
jgi:hypothetical protein